MTNTNLYQELGVSGVDQSEFESLLLEFFGVARERDAREVEYGPTDNGASLVVAYSKAGKIVSIQHGANLTEVDVSKIKIQLERDLVPASSSIVRAAVFFASVPVEGAFRYKQEFQLRPAPDEAPRPTPIHGADNPFVVEFCVAPSSNPIVNIRRQEKRARELELLLSSLLNGHINKISNTSQHFWATDSTEPSRYLQHGYWWPGRVMVGDGFSSLESYPPLSRVPSEEYYQRRGIVSGQRFDLPSSIERHLEAFFKLPPVPRERYLRASYWFQFANRIYTVSQSASFVALVSAVESLMGDAPASEACEVCKSPKGQGPTQRFKDFVEQFAPDPKITEAHRKSLYQLRSSLTHGGKLMQRDHENWGFSARSIMEYHHSDDLWRVVRTAIVNWLEQQSIEP